MMSQSTPRCEVCNVELTYPDTLLLKGLDYVVCRSLGCRNIMSRKASMPPLMFRTHLQFNKKLIREKREKDILQKKYIKHLIAKENRENRQLLDATLQKNPGLSAHDIRLLVIPSGPGSVQDVQKKRVKQYIKHLKIIIQEAGEYAHASEIINNEHTEAQAKLLRIENRFQQTPGLKTTSDRMCAMCKGGCCVSGKEHAYLSAVTIRTYLDAHPSVSARDLLTLYKSYISPRSMQNSCINHTQTGCALPRELRSAICNSHFCSSLQNLLSDATPTSQQQKLLVIQRSSSYWQKHEPGVSNEIVDTALIDTDSSQGEM